MGPHRDLRDAAVRRISGRCNMKSTCTRSQKLDAVWPFPVSGSCDISSQDLHNWRSSSPLKFGPLDEVCEDEEVLAVMIDVSLRTPRFLGVVDKVLTVLPRWYMRWLDVDWVGVEMKDKDLWENWRYCSSKKTSPNLLTAMTRCIGMGYNYPETDHWDHQRPRELMMNDHKQWVRFLIRYYVETKGPDLVVSYKHPHFLEFASLAAMLVWKQLSGHTHGRSRIGWRNQYMLPSDVISDR